jgi:hypothetical protein
MQNFALLKRLGRMKKPVLLKRGMMSTLKELLMSAEYGDPVAARFAGILAKETPMILTPPVAFALILAAAFATMRYGGYSKIYANVTAGLSLIMIALAVAEWYGSGNLGTIIMTLALGWLAITSLLTIQPSTAEAR